MRKFRHLKGIFFSSHATLKICIQTAVDKGGDITDPTNFRPISVLSILTQIFEKLVCKQ